MNHATTRIEARLSADGSRVDVVLAHGAFAPRLIDRADQGARVALVSVVALLLADDAVRIEVVVGPGVDLEVVETSGAVAYDMDGGSARWDVDLTLEEGAKLTWLGLPFVVSTGASVARSTHAQIAEGARLVLRERVVLGRSGERGGDLQQRTSMYAGAHPLLVESLDFMRFRQSYAGLAGRRCVDSLTVIGAGPAPDVDVAYVTDVDVADVTVLALAIPGWIARSITDQSHQSGLDAVLTSMALPT